MHLPPKKTEQDSHAAEAASGMEAVHGDPSTWTLLDVLRLGVRVTWEHRGFWALLAGLMMVWTIHPLLALIAFPYTWALAIQGTRDALEGHSPRWRVAWWNVLPVFLPLSLLQAAIAAAWANLSVGGGMVSMGGMQLAYELTGTTAGDTLAMAGTWAMAGEAFYLEPFGPDFLACFHLMGEGTARLNSCVLPLAAVVIIQMMLVVALCFGGTQAVLEGGTGHRGVRLAGCPMNWLTLAVFLLGLRMLVNGATHSVRIWGSQLMVSCPALGELVCYANVWVWLLVSNLFVVFWTLQYLRVRKD